jgi:hypothetical protein
MRHLAPFTAPEVRLGGGMRAGKKHGFDLDGADREQAHRGERATGAGPRDRGGDWPVCPRFRSGAARRQLGSSWLRNVPRRAWRVKGRGSNKRRQSFDPQRVGQLECALWVAYYRREWMAFVRSAFFLIRHVFGLPWPSTARGSWFVLRATHLWAPCPDNDPVAARVAMERFYRLLKEHNDEPFDPAEAARLEVEWWRVHRENQHNNADSDERALIEALAELYSYVFGMPDTAVRHAAEQRAQAMRYCDQWVQAGCDLESPLIAQERAALARSYAGLLAAVHQRGVATHRAGEPPSPR